MKMDVYSEDVNDHSLKPKVIKLNVGGKKYETTYETLCSKQSMLSSMFSGRFQLLPDEDGFYFIDRDGKNFRYILNYLRDGIIPNIESKSLIEELFLEARYYQLEGLIKYLSTVRRTDFLMNPSNVIKELYFPVGRLTEGIINWIGTKGFTQHWENPVDLGLIKINPSTVHANTLFSNVSSVISNNQSTFYTSPSKGPPHYIEIIFPRSFLVTPTHYILGAKTGLSPLRNWDILAKETEEEGDWIVISSHSDDESLQNGGVFTFEVNVNKDNHRRFQCLKILSTGSQGGKKGQTHVGTSAFEIFGYLNIE